MKLKILIRKLESCYHLLRSDGYVCGHFRATKNKGLQYYSCYNYTLAHLDDLHDGLTREAEQLHAVLMAKWILENKNI